MTINCEKIADYWYSQGEGGIVKIKVGMVPDGSIVEIMHSREVVNVLENRMSIKFEPNYGFEYI